ncbi:MFS transporter [Streptomyces lydicus]|uniref:MFS transporter n=1 Tax=Streptomyces lydicus TaxID=47763 RepID=UPI003701E796
MYISRTYPVTARASAVGVALGVGRIGAIAGPTLGGWLLAADLAPRWNFILFAVPAVLGAILARAAGGRTPRDDRGPTPRAPGRTPRDQGRPAPAPRAQESIRSGGGAPGPSSYSSACGWCSPRERR